MNIYIVCIKSAYIRDAQVYDSSGLTDEEFQTTDPYDTTSEWIDIEPCPYIDRIVAGSETEACKKVGEKYYIHPRCLFAIKISMSELLNTQN